MPSTMKELISKDPQLKAKYGQILTLPSGDYNQDQIEQFVKQHPHIEDDLANHYLDQILKRTNAKSIEDISQAWLSGINGLNHLQKKGIDYSQSPRNQKAKTAYSAFEKTKP